MKYAFIKTTLAVFVAAFVITGCNVTSHTEKAAGVNFGSYKTFAWAASANKKTANDIIDNNIKNEVATQLEKKGWSQVAANPDVVIDYTVGIAKETKRESRPVYSYPRTQLVYGGRGRVYSYLQPSYLMGYRNENVPYKEGQLTLNMTDAKTNKLVWQGWADEEVNSRNITSKQVTAEVKSIFKKFNYKA